MSTPDPATTKWVPLWTLSGPGGTGAMGLTYKGAYAAGTYVDGDIVIGSDGIAYLCINPTTTSPIPSPWPAAGPIGQPGPQGPQGPQGVPGPAGSGVPTVQNGKWLNGSGGAAVWASIGQPDLPQNLGAGCIDLPGLDCNAVAVSGWYWANNTCANIPFAQFNGYLVTYVAAFNNGHRRQIAHLYSSADRYERYCVSGVWSAWVQTQWTDPGWVNFPTPHQNGWVNYPGYPPARYRRLATGLVILSGLLQSGTNNTIFNSLPSTHAPTDYYRHFGSMGNDAIASVRIATSGTVQLTYPGGGWITIDGVSFFP